MINEETSTNGYNSCFLPLAFVLLSTSIDAFGLFALYVTGLCENAHGLETPTTLFKVIRELNHVPV